MYHRYIAWRDGARVRRLAARSMSPAKLAEVPPALLPYWKKTACTEFPGLPVNAFFYARALEGLVSFFNCVRIAGIPCALPSRAVDSVWHAWLAFDPAGLEDFCVRHFGRPIPHHPAGTMPGDPDLALAACLVAPRLLQVQAPAGPALPRLFELDGALRMPLGFSYAVDHGRVRCGRLDRLGKPCGPRRYPPALTPIGLLHAGLVTEAQCKAAMKQAARHDPGYDGGPLFIGGWGNEPCGEAGCDAGADAGGDSGGSSSCGGGCGGGGGD